MVACLLVAALSLLLPSTPTNDPWAWIVWGREVAGLSLDTTSGASWKPLPVLFTTVLSPLGDSVPELWLVIARTGALMALVLAYRLAARLAGPAAGAAAVATLALTPTADPRFLYYAAHGLSEPLLTALLLAAIERHLDGHRGQAFVLAFLAALLRPEVWPFLAGYAIVLCLRDATLRPLVVALSAAIPPLWFGVDWWASGEPLSGAARARGGGALSPELADLVRAVRRAAEVVILPAWVAGVAAVALPPARTRRVALWLGAGAIAWLALIVGGAALDYAGASRFMLPAAGILSVLAGVGFARLVRVTLEGRGVMAGAAAGALLLVTTLVLALPRLAALPKEAARVSKRVQAQDDLRTALGRARPSAALLGCGDVTVEHFSGEATALAWLLEVPMSRIDRLDPREPIEPGLLIVHSRRGRARARTEGGPPAERLAGAGIWDVYGRPCPGAAAAMRSDPPGARNPNVPPPAGTS